MTDLLLKEQVKDQTVLVGRVQRHVMATPDKDRATDVIHPSELARDDFCPRAVWHRLLGHPEINPEPSHHFALLSIFAEGAAIHTKWQTWLWDMGELIGEYLCIGCKHLWWARAPRTCPQCGAGRAFLRYKEVPAEEKTLMVAGRADSRVDDMLQEYKSVAMGTVRIDYPELYDDFTYRIEHPGHHKEVTWIDFEGMWRAIKRPFPSHLRQLMFYLYLTGLERGQIIYECKWNQQVKEFNVRFTERLVAPMIDMCKSVVAAVGSGGNMRCPHGGCTKCQVYEGTNDAPETDRRLTAAGSADPGGEGRAREERLQRPGTPGDRAAPTADQSDGDHRRPADGALLNDRPLARPYRRVAGAPRGGRTVRREHL